ncbi:hypothetical protein HOLleu_03140 [Holothuria leucospilota]|uniref:HTH psq-type domain-containing protein n=1 Tax=Holothuria leucospilota TaxID=206669 RepID=A0A9Q1CRK6_HOLLE|nr:hypothetical protein HOLleu_03140 [Holothuria leucospilota]
MRETLEEEALHKIRKGELSVRKASATFAIPKTTLLDKVSGRCSDYAKSGPPGVLSDDEERLLVEWLINMSKIWYGQTRQQLSMVVKKF